MDKRIRYAERVQDGRCMGCGRRHIHKDDCHVLKRRQRQEAENDGTDPDKPPLEYAGGWLS
jgi:hypothetical protein